MSPSVPPIEHGKQAEDLIDLEKQKKEVPRNSPRRSRSRSRSRAPQLPPGEDKKEDEVFW